VSHGCNTITPGHFGDLRKETGTTAVTFSSCQGAQGPVWSRSTRQGVVDPKTDDAQQEKQHQHACRAWRTQAPQTNHRLAARRYRDPAKQGAGLPRHPGMKDSSEKGEECQQDRIGSYTLDHLPYIEWVWAGVSGGGTVYR